MSLDDDLIHVENKAACPTLGLRGENSSWEIKNQEAKRWSAPTLLRFSKLYVKSCSLPGEEAYGPTQEATCFQTILKETSPRALPQGRPPRIAQLRDGKRR